MTMMIGKRIVLPHERKLALRYSFSVAWWRKKRPTGWRAEKPWMPRSSSVFSIISVSSSKLYSPQQKPATRRRQNADSALPFGGRAGVAPSSAPTGISIGFAAISRGMFSGKSLV